MSHRSLYLAPAEALLLDSVSSSLALFGISGATLPPYAYTLQCGSLQLPCSSGVSVHKLPQTVLQTVTICEYYAHKYKYDNASVSLSREGMQPALVK